MYQMTVLHDGTRIRNGHNTFADVLTSTPAGTTLTGDMIWVAPQDGEEVRAGDRWLRVTWQGLTGWTAYTHKGAAICKSLAEIPKPPMEDITSTMQSGRVARLRVDWLNPKWSYDSRDLGDGRGLSSPPHTVTFNERMRGDKGAKIPLTPWMDSYLLTINSLKAYRGWKDPKSGWINSGKFPEALSFAGNDVVVKDIVSNYANIHALNCFSEDVTDTFFSPNGRLVIHKFNAVTKSQKLIKMGPALDAFMPFMKNSAEYWIPLDRLEFYPALPFKLTDGSLITEYLLLGDETWGITKSGKVCLYNPRDKYTTNWKLKNPPVPPYSEERSEVEDSFLASAPTLAQNAAPRV